MRVIGEYPHAGGESIRIDYPNEYREIIEAVEFVDALACLTKISEEKTRQRQLKLEVKLIDEADPVDGTEKKKKEPKSPLIFSPPAINKRLKESLYPLGWAMNTPEGYREHEIKLGKEEHPRWMDGIKNDASDKSLFQR